MSIQDLMKHDMSGVFYAGNGQGFDVPLNLTPQGGVQRTVNGIVEENVDEHFETGTADLDFDVRVVRISAVDDVNGITVPKELGRNGNTGDTWTIPGSSNPAQTWWTRKIIENGLDSGTFEHVLLIANSQAAFLEMI